MKRRNGHDPATPEGARQDADRPVADESEPAPESVSVDVPLRATEFAGESSDTLTRVLSSSQLAAVAPASRSTSAPTVRRVSRAAATAFR